MLPLEASILCPEPRSPAEEYLLEVVISTRFHLIETNTRLIQALRDIIELRREIHALKAGQSK